MPGFFYRLVRPSDASSHISWWSWPEWSFHQYRWYLVNKKYERFHLGVMNVGARIFGGGLLVVGVSFLLTAVLSNSDRVLFAVLGLLATGGGIAFLVVKPIRPGDIENLIDGKAQPRRTGTYEKRK